MKRWLTSFLIIVECVVSLPRLAQAEETAETTPGPSATSVTMCKAFEEFPKDQLAANREAYGAIMVGCLEDRLLAGELISATPVQGNVNFGYAAPVFNFFQEIMEAPITPTAKLMAVARMLGSVHKNQLPHFDRYVETTIRTKIQPTGSCADGPAVCDQILDILLPMIEGAPEATLSYLNEQAALVTNRWKNTLVRDIYLHRFKTTELLHQFYSAVAISLKGVSPSVKQGADLDGLDKQLDKQLNVVYQFSDFWSDSEEVKTMLAEELTANFPESKDTEAATTKLSELILQSLQKQISLMSGLKLYLKRVPNKDPRPWLTENMDRTKKDQGFAGVFASTLILFMESELRLPFRFEWMKAIEQLQASFGPQGEKIVAYARQMLDSVNQFSGSALRNTGLEDLYITERKIFLNHKTFKSAYYATSEYVEALLTVQGASEKYKAHKKKPELHQLQDRFYDADNIWFTMKCLGVVARGKGTQQFPAELPMLGYSVDLKRCGRDIASADIVGGQYFGERVQSKTMSVERWKLAIQVATIPIMVLSGMAGGLVASYVIGRLTVAAATETAGAVFARILIQGAMEKVTSTLITAAIFTALTKVIYAGIYRDTQILWQKCYKDIDPDTGKEKEICPGLWGNIFKPVLVSFVTFYTLSYVSMAGEAAQAGVRGRVLTKLGRTAEQSSFRADLAGLGAAASVETAGFMTQEYVHRIMEKSFDADREIFGDAKDTKDVVLNNLYVYLGFRITHKYAEQVQYKVAVTVKGPAEPWVIEEFKAPQEPAVEPPVINEAPTQ